MLSISVDPDDEDYLIVEFRAEVNYEELEEIGDSLNKVIQRYDKDAYFEPVTSGITRAYINLSDIEESINEGTDNESVEQSFEKDMLDTIQESLQENGEDGWGDRVEQILIPTISKVEDLAYEVRNTVRGANTGCYTTDELADYIDELIEDFEDANSSLRHEAKEINESHEDDIEPNLPTFNELRKQYKNYTTFKEKEKNSGLIRDLCDQLENKKVSYDIYNHKKDNGMTIFYDDCELVESTKVDSEELEALVRG